jgi:hypothetical protein
MLFQAFWLYPFLVINCTKFRWKKNSRTCPSEMLTGSKDVDMQLTKVELPGVVHSSLFDRYKTTGDAPHRYHEAGCVSYGPKRLWHMMLVTFWRFYACWDCRERMSCCDVIICMHFVSTDWTSSKTCKLKGHTFSGNAVLPLNSWLLRLMPFLSVLCVFGKYMKIFPFG